MLDLESFSPDFANKKLPIKPVSAHIYEVTEPQVDRLSISPDDEKSLVVIITGYSGGGKDSLVKELLKKGYFSRVITDTTRKPQKRDSLDEYNWRTWAEFQAGLDNGDYLENFPYAGNHYGTRRSIVKRIYEEHLIPIFRVDPRGARNLVILQKDGEELFGDRNIICFFVLPPNLEELKNRLTERTEKEDDLSAEEKKERVEKRLNMVPQDSSYLLDANYLVVNETGKLEEVAAEVVSLINKYKNLQKLSQSSAIK